MPAAGQDSAASEMQVITRGKFISMLAESSGEELQQYIQVCSPFSDVKNEDEAVSWAYAKWLINGGGDGRFRPNDRLNRQEAAAILADISITDIRVCRWDVEQDFPIQLRLQNGPGTV